MDPIVKGDLCQYTIDLITRRQKIRLIDRKKLAENIIYVFYQFVLYPFIIVYYLFTLKRKYPLI